MANNQRLDLSRGLKATGNNERLYRRTLQAFLDSEKKAVDEIRQSLQDRKVKRAEHLAKTLKSQAAYLGALGLYQATSELVRALANWHHAVSELDATLEKTQCQIDGLRNSLGQPPVVAAHESPDIAMAAPLSKEQAKAVVKQITDMVRNNDLEALYVLEQYRPALLKHFGSHLLGIEQALQRIDFENADVLLATSIQSIQPGSPMN